MTGFGLIVFTVFHVAVSLAAIGSGGIATFGFLKGRNYPHWNGLFLGTSAITYVTGFLFPFHGLTPGIVIGVDCLLVLAVAVPVVRTSFGLTSSISCCQTWTLGVLGPSWDKCDSDLNTMTPLSKESSI